MLQDRAGFWTRWWIAPGGLREVLALAMPLVVSTISWTLLTFVDRVFLTWHSKEALAAALPAGMLAFTVACLPWGLASYVSTFVAQYHGADRPARIGPAVWQGVWLGVASMPLIVATNLAAPWLFAQFGHTPQIVEYEVEYYAALNWGSGPMIVSAALAAFFSGRGDTRTVMLVDCGIALLNAGLDYAWIFGHAGFPAWGVAGAAWATTVSLWIKALVLFGLWLARAAHVHRYHLWIGCRFDPGLMGRLLWYGTPSGLQVLIEVTAFTLFLLLVGRLGETDLAATSLAFNVNNLAFFPIYGVGLATSILVGQRLGAEDEAAAVRATWTAFAVSVAYVAAVAAVYVLLPHLLLLAHREGADAAEFAAIEQRVTVLLRFVAAYCLFDAMNVVFSSAVKGAGDTRFVMLTSLALAPLPVAATWWALDAMQWGLIAAWWAITGWVVALGVAFLARFLQGHWRRMRVIEPALAD